MAPARSNAAASSAEAANCLAALRFSILGIGVQRVLLHTKPMASARDDDVAAVFLEAFEAITQLPQGS
jgi:predicted metal-dependent HD superfamily phosphohydrolase